MKKLLFVLCVLGVVMGVGAIADSPSILTVRTTRVSVSSSGEQSNGESYYASISSDGRYVAFQSGASNLGPSDPTIASHVFVHSLTTRRTEMISVPTDREGFSGAPSISGDGRRIAFETGGDVYVHDRGTGETILIARLGLHDPVMSANSRFIAFASGASDLVADDTNGQNDVFVHDLDMGVTKRVSVSSFGAQGNGSSLFPSISGDGRLVAFTSGATNLAPSEEVCSIFLHDVETGQTLALPTGRSLPHLSADGRYVAFMQYYWNGAQSVKLALDTYDVTEQTWSSTIVGTSTGDEAEGNPPRVSISSDGKHVAFCSDFSTLVDGDNNGMRDVFVYHVVGQEVVRVSEGCAATESNGVSYQPSISADGRLVAFQSHSNNLVPGDTNAHQDIFVYDATEYDYAVHLPLALKVFQQ